MTVYKKIKVSKVAHHPNKFQLEIESDENGHFYSSSMKCLYLVGNYIVQTGLNFNPIAVYTSWDDFTKRTKESFGVEPELNF